MFDDATIGARLRVLRKWRRLTQKELADLSGLSQSFLSMAERGERALDRRSHIAALASALRVSEMDLVGSPHLSADPLQLDPHLAIPTIRTVLQTNTLVAPATERARPLSELIVEMGRIESFDQVGNYIEVGKLLPAVLDELHVHACAPADEASHRMALETLIDACKVASFDAKDLGYPDLAYVAATRAVEAADMLDDPVQRGKADFVRLITMPRGDAWSRTLAAAEKAAATLQPHVQEPAGIQVLGMLTLAASLSAVVVGDYDRAGHWLDEAAALADRVPDDPVNNWERFSTTNVGVWRVAVSVEQGKSGGAVTGLAEKVDEAKLASKPCRRAALYADVGRGLARERKSRDEAVRWLRKAERAAPQMIRNSSQVRHTVEVLHGQALASAVSLELRGMMARMGIPH
jgi:transcriptional regulator with XRE-family HTH domain